MSMKRPPKSFACFRQTTGRCSSELLPQIASLWSFKQDTFFKVLPFTWILIALASVLRKPLNHDDHPVLLLTTSLLT